MAKNFSFSYSKMGMYKECPQKYKFRYVHMLPEQPKYYFAFGTALHRVMEFIHDPKRAVFPTLAEALQFFTAHWNETTFAQKGYASVEKELAGYDEGRRIIEAYYERFGTALTHPLSVELKSTLETDGLSLISILDRIDYIGDGQIKILDYKTGKTVQREPDQLYMYQKVAENSPAVKALVQAQDPKAKEIRVAKLSFYHLPTLSELSFDRAPDKEIFAFWQNVLSVADNIRAGKFEPTPGETQCRFCDYRNLCPVFTGKEYTAAAPARKAVTPVKTAEPVRLPQEELCEKIDAYGALVKQAEALKASIIQLMQSQQISRQFATHFEAELVREEQLTCTDKQQVIALLRKLNLLTKTLVPTQRTIAALLTDPSVSQEAKQSLQALFTKTQQLSLSVKESH